MDGGVDDVDVPDPLDDVEFAEASGYVGDGTGEG